jgi:hypothetical protein
MNGLKTSFDQVPIEIARRASMARNGLAFCAVCGNSMALEDCKTDERGQAVHQKCYFTRLTNAAKKKAARTLPKKRAELWR